VGNRAGSNPAALNHLLQFFEAISQVVSLRNGRDMENYIFGGGCAKRGPGPFPLEGQRCQGVIWNIDSICLFATVL
jgi:hypothetical protein